MSTPLLPTVPANTHLSQSLAPWPQARFPSWPALMAAVDTQPLIENGLGFTFISSLSCALISKLPNCPSHFQWSREEERGTIRKEGKKPFDDGGINSKLHSELCWASEVDVSVSLCTVLIPDTCYGQPFPFNHILKTMKKYGHFFLKEKKN